MDDEFRTAEEAEEIAYPRLSDAQIDQLEAYATVRRCRAGEPLIQAGESDFEFFVVKEGEVEVVEESGGERKVVAVHGPREFTGDVDMLTGRPAVLSVVARGEAVVYEITADELRRILSEQPQLGDQILAAFLARRRQMQAQGLAGVTVAGSRHSRDTLRVRDFLSKNQVPFTWLDVERHPRLQALLGRFHVPDEETPVVDVHGKAILKNPSNRELGEVLNITRPVEAIVYDLLIVGAGPAGLAAAVYASSEGLKTLVLEQEVPGGQASKSARIENYMGFPTGLAGSELANRAVLQAQKFGATVSSPVEVTGLSSPNDYHVVQLADGQTAVGRCVLIATGAAYRELQAENCERFEGLGVYYSATAVEAQLCADRPVIVAGGGNAAGQAAVFMADKANQVLLVMREGGLDELMSRYMAARIEQTDNIEVLPNSDIVRVEGDERVEAAAIRDNGTGEERREEAAAIFIFIGAEPHTAWLPPEIETDEHGFIKTGPDVAESAHWPLERRPHYLETSRPGIFAAGDVRAGSIKRVASAVGEGSMTVHFVHQFLAE